MSDPEVEVRYVEVKPGGSVIAGAIWMAVLSLLLFWLPVIGPLVAGVVGGKKAGGIMAGIMAALLPIVILAFIVFFFSSALGALPIVGVVFAAGTVIVLSASIGPLLLGAIIGGLLA